MPCNHKTIAPDGYKTNASYERKTDALTASCKTHPRMCLKIIGREKPYKT